MCTNYDIGTTAMEIKRNFFVRVAHDLGFHVVEDLTKWEFVPLLTLMDYEVIFDTWVTLT